MMSANWHGDSVDHVDHPEPEAGDEAETLDWSVSCISVVSSTTGKPSSRSNSTASSVAGGTARNRENNTEDQFCKLEAEYTSESDSTLNNVDTEGARNGFGAEGLNQTPPVRDVGPAIVLSRKADGMRMILRDLEDANARKKVSAASANSQSHSSKIPRRSLSFTGSLPNILTRSNTGSSSSSALSTPRASMQSQSASKEDSNNATVIEKGSEAETAHRLAEAEVKCQHLEKRNSELLHHYRALEAAMAQKDELLGQLRLQWNSTLQKLNGEQIKWVERTKALEAENKRIRAQEEKDKKALAILEEEMEKALILASDFKDRAEDEEKTRVAMAEELEKCCLKAKEEEGRAHEALISVERLNSECQSLRCALSKSNECTTSLKKIQLSLENENKDLLKKVNQLEQKHSELEIEVSSTNADRQATESSLHAFYQSQTERIVAGRVASLKEDVEHYEKVIKDEHDREVAALRAEFAVRNKELKEKLVHEVGVLVHQFGGDKSSLESSLKEARKEADCLREQLRLAEARLGTTKPAQAHRDPDRDPDRRWHDVLSDRPLTGAITMSSRPASTPPVGFSKLAHDADDRAKAAIPVLNNMRSTSRASRASDSSRAKRSRSRDVHVTNFDSVMTSWKERDSIWTAVNNLKSPTMTLTPREKEDMFNEALTQYLSAHPSLALDTSLAERIRTTKTGLVHEAPSRDVSLNHVGSSKM